MKCSRQSASPSSEAATVWPQSAIPHFSGSRCLPCETKSDAQGGFRLLASTLKLWGVPVSIVCGYRLSRIRRWPMSSLSAGHFRALAFASFTALVDRGLLPASNFLRTSLEMGKLQTIGLRPRSGHTARLDCEGKELLCGRVAQAHGDFQRSSMIRTPKGTVSVICRHLSVCGRARCFG